MGDERDDGIDVETYLDFVRSIAWKIDASIPLEVERDDLVQEGAIALISAAEAFDPSRGFRFSTYARHRVRGRMLDCVRSHDAATVATRRKAKRIAKVRKELEQRLGRRANEEEMAISFGISLREFQELADATVSPRFEKFESLARSAAFEPEAESRYGDEIRDALAVEIASLPERTRKILVLYYDEDRTFEEIGRRVGIGLARVTAIHHHALRKLRAKLRVFLSDEEGTEYRAT